ncbi:hypothetical protein [Paenibacillus sp. DMB5]|uniref:hypothetical protein n=1 Tax=Paenibacillus sp. DMB5 TaxID=1780103 RepID=UPI000FE13F16|nr:hypothetical protein [Paenibacillus sp. DMB5]
MSNNPLKYIDPSGHWQEGDENLNIDVQDRIIQLTKEWNDAKGNSHKQAEIHAEADLLRGLDKMFSNEFAPFKESFSVYDTTEAIEIIQIYDSYINLTSQSLGVSKEMIAAVLFREMRCFAPDDAFDPYKLSYLGQASIGLGQIFISTARRSETTVLGKTSTKTDQQYYQLLMNNETNIFYIGIINMNLNPSSPNQAVLTAYNGSSNYGSAVMSYVKLFQKYYSTIQ